MHCMVNYFSFFFFFSYELSLETVVYRESGKDQKKKKGFPPERLSPLKSMNYVGQNYTHIGARAAL